MKKSVRSLIMCLASVLGVGAFATACGESSAFGDENEHVHTYSDDWTADAEGHFHDYTCDCTDIPEKEAHVDDNNDGVCDLCKFTDHEHTYSEDWTVDCTNHWHAADCGHIVAGVDLAEHVDENEDGECDVCKYVIEDIHEHVYSPDWTSDDEYHWHAALCEHKDQVSGHEAHQLNEAGDCTVCKEHVKDVDLTNLEKVLAAAMANNYKIAYGDVIAVDTVYDGVGKQTVMSGKTNKVHFALGNGQSYIQYVSFDKDGVFNGVEEQWFERQENGEVYGVKKAYGEYELEPTAGDEQFLNGYNYIPGSILPSDSDDTTTLANTLMALYNQMKAGVRVSNATESYDPQTGKYSFAYTYYSVNTTTSGGEFYSIELELYNVAVEFTVNADMIIDAADFSVEVYRDYENDSDLDYTYDVAYDEAGNCIVTITSDVTLKASANPSTYEYSVAQVSGERTFTTPYPRESLVPTSFEFSYVTKYEFPDAFDFQLLEEVPIEDTLTLPTGTYAYFHIGDILPKTASSKFLVAEDFTYSFVNNDPNSTGRAWYDSDSIINGYSAYISCLKLKLRDVGEYTVTIAFGDIQKTFTLIVEGEQEVVLPDDTASKIYVQTTDTYAWVDEKSYTANASGTYTFNLPAGLGFWSVDAQQPEMDFYNNANGDSVSFDLAAGEKLTFTVGAITKGTWEITVDFVAGEVEGGGNEGGDVVELTEKDLVIGNNSNNAADVKYVYTAETAGTLTIKYGGFVMGSNSSITYVVNDGTATTLEAGVMAELVLAAGDVVAVNVYANGGYATVVTTWTADESGDVGGDTSKYETVIVAGSNNVVFSAAEISANAASRTLTITEEGKYQFASDLFVSSIVDAEGNTVARNDDYTYTLTAGDYTISFGMFSNFGIAADADNSLNVNKQAVEEENDEPAGVLYAGEENVVSVDAAALDAGSLVYTFMPWDNGDYKFKNSSIMFTVTTESGDAVDRNADYSYTLVAYERYYVTLGLNLVGEAGDYVVEIEYLAPLGSQDNPIAIEMGDNVANYKGDWTPIWHSFVATADGTVTVSSTNTEADIMLGAHFGSELSSENGVVTMDVLEGVTYYVGVADWEANEAVEIVFNVAFVAGEVTLDGTINLPYALVAGENTAAVPEWDYVWYTFKANSDGVLTLTTADDNADWSVQKPTWIGATDGTITVEMAAGDIIYLQVGTMDSSAADVVFNAVWEGAPEAVEVTLTTDGVANAVNVAANTYAVSSVYAMGMGNTYTVTWDNADAIVEINGVVAESGATVEIGMYAPANIKIMGADYAAVSVNVTIAAYVDPTPAEPDGSEGNPYVVDTLPYSITKTGLHDFYITYTVEKDCTLVISYTGGYVTGLPNNFEKDSTAKTYTGTVTAGQVLTINPWVMSSAADTEYTYTISEYVAPPAPDGSQGNPFIAETLPYSYTVEGSKDFYIQYTATEDCTIMISYPAGNYVSACPSNFNKDAANCNYSGTVTAGQVIVFNPWGNNAGTYTISKVEVQTPDPEQPGEGGGEVDGDVVTLVSDVAANGKMITLTIDKVNATMSITRSNSDGSSASTAVYTYTFDDAGTFTGVKQSGNICTFVWGDNGIPTTVTWNGVAFTNFK